MKAKNILVTGGAGFIGGHLARRCLDEGHRVWVADDLSTGQKANVPEDAKFLKLDLGRQGFSKRLPRVKFDAVLHLAAQSSGEISSEHPAQDFRINLAGTVELLSWASRNARQFLYASSMAAYGNPASLPVAEDSPLAPLSVYGLNKSVSEEYVRRYSRPGFGTVSFRMFSVYGPGQNMANLKQGMISIYMAYALRQKPVLVKGSMDRFRDFVYVDDVVDAWMAALGNPAADGRVYNVGSGRKTTVREAVREILKALGEDPDRYPVASGAPTPADQFGVVADISRIRSELGWRPKIGLAEGLRRMAAWAKEAAA